MLWLELLAPIATLLSGGAVGYFLKYYLDKKASIASRLHSDKREHYRTLLLALKSISEGSDEHLALLYFEYSFMWLHSSDSVIRAANDLLAALGQTTPGSPMPIAEVARLLAEVRRDLGIKTKLHSKDYAYRFSGPVELPLQ